MKTINHKSTPVTAMLQASQIVKTFMRKTFLMIGAALVLASASTSASHAAAPTMKKLNSRIPEIVAQMKAIGTTPAETNLSLAIGLPLRNREALTNLLQQLYDPSSANYHRYLTPEQFTAQFGPTEQDYAMVANFARMNGLTVTHTHGNRVLLDVSGKASDIGKAFHTTLKTYKHPTESRVFFAPDVEPSVDAALPILSVQGLNNYQLPRPMLTKMPASGGISARGSGPFGSYIGKDFRNAYLPGSALNGSGQIVGLLQFDGYFASDIASYLSLAGMTNVPLENVLLDGFSGAPGFNNGEVCLDIETSIAMAPALEKVVVFEAGPFGNPNDILSSMAARSEIKQFSASWGYTTDATTEQLYQQLALQGQTFFNASGDGDAWLGPIPFGSCESPNITIVGGTTLTMNGQGVSYASETAWNWGFIGNFNWNPDGFFGTSGGISTTVAIPTWQQGISMTTNHGSLVFRNVPDIALTADNVFVVSDGGFLGAFGGTSCASPLWAGFMALINQQAAANGNPPLGFLAPTVYSLAKTTNYANCFHDTIAGDNTWDRSLTNFFAVPGYDLCTGLGTPNGTNLIKALAGVANPIVHLSPPPPPYGSTLANLNGGNPNGNWQLFVLDDTSLNTGIISNGWVLTLTTASPVGQSGNLELLMTVSSTNVLAGTNLVYVIGLTNYGPSASSNVVVSDNFSAGVTLLGATATQGSVSGLTWNVGTLASGAGAQLRITVRPNSSGSILNFAIARADTPDPNENDNFASIAVNVVTLAPPQLSGSFIGGNHQFQFSITDPSLQPYVVQASTNLVNWVPIYTNPAPAATTTIFPDTTTTNYMYRFYRVLLQ